MSNIPEIDIQQSNTDEQVQNIKKLKHLVKNLNQQDWENALQDVEFKKFISNHKDKDGNVYHAIFKNISSDKDKAIKSTMICSLLLQSEIPIYGFDDKGRLPSEIAKGKSFISTEMKTREISEQKTQLHNFAFDDFDDN